MEWLFWILFFSPVAIVAYVIIAGIIGAIATNAKRGKIAKKYITEGLISAKQKAKLPDILFETAQEKLAEGNVNRAVQLLEDCRELCSLNKNEEQGQSTSFELAKCYSIKGNIEKALGILSGLTIPQAYLLRGELMLKRNRGLDCKYAVQYLERALENEDTKERAQELLNKAENLSDEHYRDELRKRFESAIKYCDRSTTNHVGLAKYTSPGNHLKSLTSKLEMYEAIEEHVGLERRKDYNKQLAILALEISDLCCYLGFHESAYAYLEYEDFTEFPQVNFLYAMLYSGSGPDKCYGYGSRYPKEAQEKIKSCLKKRPLPRGLYEHRLEKAIEYAKIAQKSGVHEATSFVSALEYSLESYRRNEVYRKVQAMWDKQFEEKYGMSRDEYDEYMEERRQEAQERQEMAADVAAKDAARKKRFERDLDLSEMLFDKTHEGTGKTMEEKWQAGEISNVDYLEYKNKRDQYVDSF